MSAKKGVRVAAREAMQKLNYCPLETLVLFAQDSQTSQDQKLDIAKVLLPYMYPKLSNVTVDGEVAVTDDRDQQARLLRKVLEDPDLADAAQRLSIAASMAHLEDESGLLQ